SNRPPTIDRARSKCSSSAPNPPHFFAAEDFPGLGLAPPRTPTSARWQNASWVYQLLAWLVITGTSKCLLRLRIFSQPSGMMLDSVLAVNHRPSISCSSLAGEHLHTK